MDIGRNHAARIVRANAATTVMFVGLMIALVGAGINMVTLAGINVNVGPVSATLFGISPLSASLIFIGIVVFLVSALSAGIPRRH